MKAELKMFASVILEYRDIFMLFFFAIIAILSARIFIGRQKGIGFNGKCKEII